MKISDLTTILLLLVSFSCTSQESETIKEKGFDPKAIELSNKAMEVSFQVTEDSVLEEALNYLSQSIQMDSSYYLAYSNMATLLVRQGKRDSAISILQIIIDNKPNYAEGLSVQGFIYDKMGQKDSAKRKYLQAMEAYDNRIKKDRGNIEAKVNKVHLMLFLSNREAAFREIEEILEEHPDNEFALIMKNNVIPYFDKKEFLQSY